MARLSRLPSFCFCWPPREAGFPFSSRAFGGGDLDRERFVDMVETESDEYEDTDGERLREGRPSERLVLIARSSSFFASSSSATPFLCRC